MLMFMLVMAVMVFMAVTAFAMCQTITQNAYQAGGEDKGDAFVHWKSP